MIILNISLYNTMALHNREVETSQNMQQTLNTLTTHTNLQSVVSEGQSKVRWRCMKWKEENISAVIQYTGDCMTQGRGNNCGQPNMQTETLDAYFQVLLRVDLLVSIKE